MKLDEWQKNVLETSGNICLVSGRQVGKSHIISIKAAMYVLKHPGKTVMIVAATERQAYLLFEKTLQFIEATSPQSIRQGKQRPTKTQLNLKNRSRIYCLPIGQSGYGIRGYTVDQLYVDEAAFVNDDVFTAITPMLATTKGDIILLSTPHGRKGYFFEASKRTDFSQFRVSSLECPRINKEFIDQERERMSKKQFAQEYLGEFIEDLDQFFPDELIKKQQKLKRPNPINHSYTYYMGIDIARMGADESTFEIVYKKNDRIYHVENIKTKKRFLTQTTRTILNLDQMYNFKKIYIDSRGVGAGVLDNLLDETQTRRKIVPIDNASKNLVHDKTKKRKLNKEELYNNLLRLLEANKIDLLDDDDIFLSLKSVQYEYDEAGNIKIYGRYTHIAEGLIRAAWSAKEKTLNISIDSFKV